MSKKLGRAINVVSLLLGIALFVGLVLGMDTRAVGDQLTLAGWTLLPAFPLFVLNLASSTMAWRETIQPGEHGHRARFGTLLAAFWAGHAINGVGITAVGEVIKGNMMARAVKGDEVVASLVIYGFLNAAVQVAFTVVAPAICLIWLELPTDVVAGIFGLSAAFGMVLFGVRWLLRRGMAGRLLSALQRLPFVELRNVEKLEAQAALVDSRVREYRTNRPASYRRAIAWSALSRVFQTLEVLAILYGLFPDKAFAWLFLLALLAQATNQLVGWLGAFVPGRVGVAEGGSTLLFELLGLGPVLGLSLGILRRIRRVLGIAVGLVIAAVVEMRVPPPPAEMEETPSAML